MTVTKTKSQLLESAKTPNFKRQGRRRLRRLRLRFNRAAAWASWDFWASCSSCRAPRQRRQSLRGSRSRVQVGGSKTAEVPAHRQPPARVPCPALPCRHAVMPCRAHSMRRSELFCSVALLAAGGFSLGRADLDTVDTRYFPGLVLLLADQLQGLLQTQRRGAVLH